MHTCVLPSHKPDLCWCAIIYSLVWADLCGEGSQICHRRVPLPAELHFSKPLWAPQYGGSTYWTGNTGWSHSRSFTSHSNRTKIFHCSPPPTHTYPPTHTQDSQWKRSLMNVVSSVLLFSPTFPMSWCPSVGMGWCMQGGGRRGKRGAVKRVMEGWSCSTTPQLPATCFQWAWSVSQELETGVGNFIDLFVWLVLIIQIKSGAHSLKFCAAKKVGQTILCYII